jgi:hypothetical protein
MEPISHLRSGLTFVMVAVLLALATAARADLAPTATPTGQAAISSIGDQPTSTGTSDNGPSAAVGNPVIGPPTGSPAVPTANLAPTDPTPGSTDQSTQTATPPQPTHAAAGSTDAGEQPAATQGQEPSTPATVVTSVGNADTGQQPAQAPGQQPTPPAAGSQSASAVESNTTSQFIWQVQVSGCTETCQGISQTQLAAQQNNTVQVVAGGPLAATSGTQAGAGGAAQSTSSITQLQVGCIWQCLGTTTTGVTIPPSAQQAVAQVLSLALAGTGLPSQQAAPAAEQNIVNQTAYQWQLGQGTTGVQTQSASQTNNTVQVVASLSAALQAAVGSSDPSAAGIMNQTEQGIWQLQIGCLIFCAQTQQYQQAEQANTTTQVLIPAPGSTAATTAAAVNSAAQVIWQMQIGCLLWCVDATEQQTAASNQTTLVAIVDSPMTSAPPPDPSTGSTSNSAVASPSSATTAPAGSNPPSDPTSSADATASGPAPVTPASGAPVPSQTTPSTRTPTTTPSTMVLPSIPFTAVPPGTRAGLRRR